MPWSTGASILFLTKICLILFTLFTLSGAVWSVTWRFWIKGGQLDPPVSDVTFFGPKDVSWSPLSVTWHFLDQRRSAGPPCQWRDVFCTKGGRLWPPVSDVRFFTPKEVGCDPCPWRPWLGFHGFQGSTLIFMVPGGFFYDFSWFQVGFSWF